MSKSRLIGVDLFRAIAAFAVIVIHAGGALLESNPPQDVTPLQVLMQFCRFAVPFYLAASFYLTVGKLLAAPQQFGLKAFLVSRTQRLVIPYAIWSGIYFAIRFAKAAPSSSATAQLLQDPLFLILLGGSAIHLYFLPLLISGSLLVPLLKPLATFLKPLRNRVVLLLVSMAIYESIFATGNAFNLGVNCLEVPHGCSVAFVPFWEQFGLTMQQPIVRVASPLVAWCLRGWLYICASAVLHHPSVQRRLSNLNASHALLWGGVFILATLGGELEWFKVIYFPLSVYELGVSYGLLLSGIALSRSLQFHHRIVALGNASFGIYLVHYLILVVYAALATKGSLGSSAVQFPILWTLVLASLTYLTSWGITLGLNRQPLLRRLLFGG
ncbi:MAG TPA: acyltransferase [Stenomitos sp.]